MEKKYYLGLDVSTQSTKLLLLDFESKRPLFVTSVQYDTDLPEYNTENGSIKGPGEGVSESDPEMWIKALHLVFGRLKESGHPVNGVKAISVSGQQHGLVCLDAEGNLARKTSKLWNDVSTYPECVRMTQAVGGKSRMIREVFNSLKPGYTASKILQFKRSDPHGFKRTATFFLVHNFINWFLTGGKNGGVRVMEPGDTSGMALWNPKAKKMSKAVCGSIDAKLLEKLPEVRPSDEFIGKISPDLSRQYGFDPGCKIDAGSGDNMYGAVGTGNVRPGIVTVSLGTSGTAFTILKKPYFDAEGEIASFCDSLGNIMPLLCVSNLANGYNRVLELYGISHDEFSSIIAQRAPGNGGRVLLPWYGGERTPDLPYGAPLYFGFGLDEFTKENLCQAVLEGHVMNFYEGFQKLPVKAKTIHLTGGMSRSRAWCQAIADIFNTTAVPVKGEGAALGAAIHAAYVDHKKEARDVAAFVNPFIEFDEENRTGPKAENVKRYLGFKKIYLNLSRRVRGAKDAADPFAARAEFKGSGGSNSG